MNTKKGLSTLLGLLLILVITVGIYVYTQTEIFNQTDTLVESKQNDNEVVKVLDTKIVKKEPVVSNDVNLSLSDETINKILESLRTEEFKGEMINLDIGFSKITKGDINSDGYEDALYIASSCGASCGTSLGMIINQKDGMGKIVELNSEKYLHASGAMETGIKYILIDKGVISITANGFIGEDPYEKVVTKKFKVENNALVEIIY